MSSIPPELYDRVRELALAITNAVVAGDDALREATFHTLKELYRDAQRDGRSHPFLTETVADYTDAPAEAVQLYQLSLEQARAFPEEPTHTKMISLAEQLISLGKCEQAEAFLRDGRAEALRRGDSNWIQHADSLLRDPMR